MGVGLGDDQGGVVGRHREPVWEGEVVGDLPRRAIRSHERKQARLKLPAREVKADVPDVCAPRPSTTRSFHGFCDRLARSATVANVP